MTDLKALAYELLHEAQQSLQQDGHLTPTAVAITPTENLIFDLEYESDEERDEIVRPARIGFIDRGGKLVGGPAGLGDDQRLVHSDRARQLIRPPLILGDASPDADCMLWSPMDAGEMIDGKIVSKKFISEVRNMQKAAASKNGCAFWDMFASMGGEGSFARWHRAGIMNDDLVHPRATAGELLGHLFSVALLEAYAGAR